jgi:hypothetical protein
MLQKTSFQIINIYSISTQNQTSELLWHYLLKGWCESDVKNSISLGTVTLSTQGVVWIRCEELYKPWYCDTIYSRGGVNQMWILKNSISLGRVHTTRSLSSCNVIKAFHFCTLYITIRHSKLKDRLIELVQLCFRKKIQRRYKYIVFGKDKSYFVKKNKKHSDSAKRFFETDWKHICYVCWTWFSTDSWHTYGYILCSFSRRLFPLFVQDILHTGASQEKRKSFNFTFRYINDEAWWFCWSRLSHCDIEKRYHRYS